VAHSEHGNDISGHIKAENFFIKRMTISFSVKWLFYQLYILEVCGLANWLPWFEFIERATIRCGPVSIEQWRHLMARIYFIDITGS